MPINEQGYIRPTYDELLARRIQTAKELFGDDVDTSNSSTLGKFIRLAVQDLADAFEVQEVVYYSRFPHTATGQSLDRLMPFASVTRNPATPAEHEITFKGTAGYTIPVGFLVGTTGEKEFYVVNPCTLDENGTGVAIVQCTELGAVGNVQLGTITEIINPDANVESISHTAVVEYGIETESDAELRTRFDNSMEGSGSATATSIRAAVMRVAGVSGCIVVENEGDTTDAEGRPPHSFQVYVHAPESANQQVAEAIFSKKPIGIKSFGDVAVQVTDISGDTKTVYFTRATDTPIYIRVTVATDSYFELNGVDQIKTALAEYINSLATGEDVIFVSLYKHIMAVDGVKDVTALTMSKDNVAFGTSNIVMGKDDTARTKLENIVVEVTSYADR